MKRVARICWIATLALCLAATVAAFETAYADAAAAGSEAALDDPTLDQRRSTRQTSVDEVSRGVMCPSCDTTLDQSDSPSAQRMRIWVTEAVDAGWTEDEIRAGLVEEYGGDESVLATPRAMGLGLAAWLFPLVIVLLAAVVGVVSLRSWRRGARLRQTRSGSSSSSHGSASSSPSAPSS